VVRVDVKMNKKTLKQSRTGARMAPGARGVRRLLRWRLVAFLGALALGWFAFGVSGCAESLFMYHPSRAAFATPAGFEEVTFETADGLTLHGWFMPARVEPGDPLPPAVLHVHGNAGNVSTHAGFSQFLPEAGVSVLLFDFRSFGRSDRGKGLLGRDDLLVDANAALDYLLSRPDVDVQQVSVLGVSLGGVIGLSLAAEREEVTRVVSVSAFASWNRIASDHLGVLGRMIATPGLDASDAAGRLGDRPLMVVHGQDDTIVPVKHASIIADAAEAGGVETVRLIVRERGHNDILMAGSSEADAVARFLVERTEGP
jgi:uncharacterized protein